MTLLLLIGQGVTTGQQTVVTPRTTADFIVKPPTLKVHALEQLQVPFLTDEAGVILFGENDQPLIDESEMAQLIIKPPTLKARKVN